MDSVDESSITSRALSVLCVVGAALFLCVGIYLMATQCWVGLRALHKAQAAAKARKVGMGSLEAQARALLRQEAVDRQRRGAGAAAATVSTSGVAGGADVPKHALLRSFRHASAPQSNPERVKFAPHTSGARQSWEAQHKAQPSAGTGLGGAQNDEQELRAVLDTMAGMRDAPVKAWVSNPLNARRKPNQ